MKGFNHNILLNKLFFDILSRKEIQNAENSVCLNILKYFLNIWTFFNHLDVDLTHTCPSSDDISFNIICKLFEFLKKEIPDFSSAMLI